MNHSEYVKFCAEHGESIGIDGRLYWPNGHWMENMPGAQPRQAETERQRLENIIRYHTELLDRVVKAFDDTKRTAKVKARHGNLNWLEKEQATDKMKEYSARAKQYRKAIKDAEKELEPLLPPKRREPNWKNPKANIEAIQEIDSIGI